MYALNQSVFLSIFSLAHRNAFLDAVGVFLAQYLPYCMVIGALVYLFSRPDVRSRLAFFIEAGLAVLLARGIIATTIHYFFPRLRPYEFLGFQPLLTEFTSSFPSGHASAYFALALAFFFWNRTWGSIYLVLAAVNAVARIYVGVHWPLDIVAGTIIGLGSAWVVHRVLKPSLDQLRSAVPHG